jgi:hypothetical protein
MIGLTEQQREALKQHPGEPLRLVDPVTQQTFVLIAADRYHQLLDYDESPWTDEELDRLAAEAGELLDSYQP